MPARKEAFRLSVFYGAYFIFMGAYLPFFPVWLSHRELNASQIGIVAGAAALVRIFAVLPIGLYADNNASKRLLIFYLSLAMLGCFSFYIGAASFAAILMVALLSNFAFSAIMPLVESISLRRAQTAGFDYGRVRLWGSATFIGASFLCGVLLEKHSAELVLWWMLAGTGLICLAALLLPQLNAQTRSPKSTQNLRRGFLLLMQPSFLFFLLAAGIVQASHAVYYAFGTLHWQNLGYGDGIIGLFWGLGVIAEILLFAFAGPLLSQMKPHGLLLIGALGAGLRWTVMGFNPPFALIVIMQCLHAFSFAATHLATMHYLLRAAPQRLAATAQMLYASVFAGALSGLAMGFSGWWYEHLAGHAYFIMAGFAVVAGVLALLSRFIRAPKS